MAFMPGEEAVTEVIYERLAEALDRLPNGFSRTKSGVEMRLLRLIFSPDEASLAGVMGRDYESPEVISYRWRQPVELTEVMLRSMTDRGLAW